MKCPLYQPPDVSATGVLTTLRSVPDHGVMLSVADDCVLHFRCARVPTWTVEERPQRERHFLPDRKCPGDALPMFAGSSAPPSSKASSSVSTHFGFLFLVILRMLIGSATTYHPSRVV